MTGLIARKDFLLNLTSAKFVIGLAVCLLAIPFTLVTSVDRYKQQQDVYKVAVEDAEQLYKSARVYSGVKPTIVHRPEALGVFSEGVSRNMGTSVQLQYGEYPLLLSGSSSSPNPFLNAFFSVDFATVIAIILSLFALVFSYDAITQERENNTLKMVMVNRINRSSFFIGKFLGILLTLLPLLLFCFTAGVLFLVLSSDIALDGNIWINIFLLFLSSILYVVVFVLFGMFISAMSPRSSTSIVVCLLCWIWFLFLMPNIAAYSAKSFIKTELYDNMASAMDNMDYEYGNEYREKEKEVYKMLGMNGMSNWNMDGGSDGFTEIYGGPRNTIDFYMNFTGWSIPRLIDYSDKKWAVQKNYLDDLVKQEKFQQKLSLLSPSEIFGQIASSLCYTDPNYYLAYMERVREYRQVFIQYVKGHKFYESSKWVTQQDPETFLPRYEDYQDLVVRLFEAQKGGQEVYRQFNEEAVPKEWSRGYYGPLNLDNFPVFDYKPHTDTGTYNFALVRFALLLGIALVLLMLALLRFRRYQI